MLHRPGIEPGPPAWQASILPLNQRCFSNSSPRIAWQNSAAHCCFKGQGLKLGPWVEMWRDRRTSKIFQVEEQNNLKKKSSPAGNRTPVSRVTGGDTYHYTTEDLMRKELIFSDLLFLPIIIYGKKKLKRSESKPTLTFYQIRVFEGVTRPIGKKNLLRAGFEPATYGFLHCSTYYSPPLYQLSYRRMTEMKPARNTFYKSLVTRELMPHVLPILTQRFRGVVLIWTSTIFAKRYFNQR